MIPLFKVYMSKNASKEATKVLNSGFIGQGPIVEKFEEALQRRLHHPHIVTTNSATSAEHLAIRMLMDSDKNAKNFEGMAYWDSDWPGIKEGDEALCTSLTCTATNFPVLANGMKIKWVDVNPNNLNMDLDDLERKLSPTTKIIYVVHWGGYPIDLDRVKEIQEKCKTLYGFKPAVIEDCAHSFGSNYKGKPIGSHGNYATFSFQAIKHLTSVDGGILICPHEKQYKRAKILRWYGIDRDDNRKDFRCETDIPEWGYKFHMNDVNASIGLTNLKEVDKNVIAKHKANAYYYNEQLKDVNGVTLLENKDGYDSAYWIYTIKVERQEDFMRMMQEKDIMVSRVHERNDKHTCVQDFRCSLPNLDKVVKEMICIPVGWWVTKEQREYIVESIKQGW
jgi:dTDP-4-amino-4,6-dideoxy-D-glucose/dTDP-4-amino-2,4-dideoxy-beta-L-xylose transaminase